MIFSIKRKYIVMVELPENSNYSFLPWGVVAVVSETGQEEAIDKAIDETPALAHWVGPGIARFLAIPVRDVPIRRAALVAQGHNGNSYVRDVKERIQRGLIKV